MSNLFQPVLSLLVLDDKKCEEWIKYEMDLKIWKGTLI